MVVELGLLVLSIGLSYLAGQLLKPKDNLGKDDKPTTLATRGSYAPWIRGTRRVGPVVCWAGNRRVAKEKIKGGKGSAFAQKVSVFHEAGLHVLCVGPAYALHRITQNGAVIFEGPITIDSHPSGSEVDLGNEGTFRVYWGESDQNGADPDATYEAATGVGSIFPYFCYVVWDDKRLGQSPMWQMIEYEVECRVQTTSLVESDAYFEPTWTLDGAVGAIHDRTNGVEGTGKFVILSDVTREFYPGQKIRLTGNALADQDFYVLRTETALEEVTPPTGFTPGVYRTLTYVFPVDGLSGASVAGNIQAYTSDENDGVNHAHVFDEVLFANFPHGLGLDRSEWSSESLEALGTLMQDEAVAGSFVSQGGQTAKEVIGPALQDILTFLTWDPNVGQHVFRPLREPVSADANLDEDLLLSPRPERAVLHGEKPVDEMIFSWPDRILNFRDMTVLARDGGQTQVLDAQRQRNVRVTSTVNFETGNFLAQMRSMEEFGADQALKYRSTRGARQLVPGDVVTVDGEDAALRVTSVGVEQLSSAIDLELLVDFFGVPASGLVIGEPGSSDSYEPVAADLAAQIVELPVYVTGDNTVMQIVVPRIRAHTGISAATIHLSRDNTTYTETETESFIQTGGTLDADFGADTARHYQGTDLVINVLGDDIGICPDYTSDEESWRSGRFLAIVNDEIMFVRSVTALGGGQYRLNDVLRARYDTERGAHTAGDVVFLVLADEITPIEDALLVPERLLYAKTQPIAGAALSLASTTPVGTYLHGKGPRPMDPANLRVMAPVPQAPIFHTGDDLEFRWSYRSFLSQAASAGIVGAGDPCAAVSFEGFFQITLLTTGDIVKLSTTSTTPGYSITNADLVTAFGSEPSAFKIQVTAGYNGLLSSTIELTVDRI